MSAVGRDRVLTTEEMVLAVERAPLEKHPKKYLCAYFERKFKKEDLTNRKVTVILSSCLSLCSMGERIIRSDRGDLLARISEVWENFYQHLILFGIFTTCIYTLLYIRNLRKMKEVELLLAKDPLANNVNYISEKIREWQAENPLIEDLN